MRLTRSNAGANALLWLPLVALLALMAWILLRSCGLVLPAGLGVLRFCDVEVNQDLQDLQLEQERARALERETIQLERELALAAACPIPEAPPSPEVEDDDVIEDPPEEDTAEVQPDEPLEPCPALRPVNVSLVMDASLSMGWNYEDSSEQTRLVEEGNSLYQQGNDRAREGQALIDELNRLSANPMALLTNPQLLARVNQLRSRIEQLDRDANNLWDRASAVYDQIRSLPGIDRIDVAKDALENLIDVSPGDVSFSYFSFNRCGAPNFHGTYAPQQRPDLVGHIQNTQIDYDTALADTIQHLQGTLTGGRTEDDPVTIVLVSDGEDTCSGDPCAAAAQLKANLPYATINVIGIGAGVEQVRCVADNTGGRFISPGEETSLADLLVSAAGQDLPEHCLDPQYVD